MSGSAGRSAAGATSPATPVAGLDEVPDTAPPAGLTEVFRRVPTSVALLTSLGPDGPSITTVTAFCCLSLAPPLVLACLDNRSRTLGRLLDRQEFAVNVLRHSQSELAAAFARPDTDRTAWMPSHFRLHRRVPILTDALAWATCTVTTTHRGGDHTIIIGLVTAADHRPGRPLVRHEQQYGSWTPTPDGEPTRL